jgi:hypothetical protein
VDGWAVSVLADGDPSRESNSGKESMDKGQEFTDGYREAKSVLKREPSSFSGQTSIANKHHVAAINNQQLPTTNSPPFATATDAYFATTSNERVTTVADSELLAIAD